MSARLAAALLVSALTLGACATEPPEPRPATTAAAPRGPACEGTLRVTNNSARIVSRLHLRDAALTNWGPDMLGRDVMAPGQSKTLRAPGPGVYDMRLLWADGQATERRRVTICTETPVSVGDFGITAR
ncbi:hypothetical protein KTR66_14300 [Roseococcus sp. SDR]|uniref:hypothetical protein n=1 Tax=Roseococcus sp. SDR TaxID=2835532 RepID=UPI001BCF29D0|nr:hypothetical protein [Roseococcus sp. SDR]MBS7791171.1 hypothetical protein [Roseococcus sp. SDR]MBV1846485.1 hypothetical protein [Roseococcus sp. SDR]